MSDNWRQFKREVTMKGKMRCVTRRGWVTKGRARDKCLGFRVRRNGGNEERTGLQRIKRRKNRKLKYPWKRTSRLFSSTLNTEVSGFSETPGARHPTVRRHFPENYNFHSHPPANPTWSKQLKKSNIFFGDVTVLRWTYWPTFRGLCYDNIAQFLSPG